MLDYVGNRRKVTREEGRRYGEEDRNFDGGRKKIEMVRWIRVK